MFRILTAFWLFLLLAIFRVIPLYRISALNQPADAITLPICTIQGSELSSPFIGRSVRVTGVVTADFDDNSQKGFYIQDENCDTNPSTSDGIFIYLGERLAVVASGDRVRVTGVVQEYYGMTEIQALPENVVILSSGNPLPPARELRPPFENQSARMYYEALESMRVRLTDGRVVGPTDSDDRSWLVQAELGVERVLYDDPLGTGEVICADDGGQFEIAPEVKTGDQVRNLEGVLDFRLGVYCMQLTSLPAVSQSGIDHREQTYQLEMIVFDLATFNLQNLFDSIDDPLTADQILSNTEYQRRLQKRAIAIAQDLDHPAILAVQEAENLAVLQALVGRSELQVNYEIVLEEGPDVRGLDVALLFRPDRATLLDYHAYQGCTGLVDGFGPDGNDDPHDPLNLQTCDRDGDAVPDGNRLFSRPPLVVHFLGRPAAGGAGLQTSQALLDVYEFWVFVCHFKSKVGDSSNVEYTLPRRIEQAQFVAGLVGQIRAENPDAQIMVLGDFNDHPGSQPLQVLTSTGLQQSLHLAPRLNRFTYIYEGISQTIDDILFIPRSGLVPVHPHVVHINADYPEALMSLADTSLRSSDHDPVWIGLTPAEPSAFIPLVLR